MGTSMTIHPHGDSRICLRMASESDVPASVSGTNTDETFRGGLYSAYSIAHAQWMWDAKTEPGVTSIFEQIWGTDKLTVSFGKCSS